jgi:hypothetical protein
VRCCCSLYLHTAAQPLCCSVCTVKHGHCIPAPSLLPISLPLRSDGSMRSLPASPAAIQSILQWLCLLVACPTANLSRVSIRPSLAPTAPHSILTCAVLPASPVNHLLLVLWVRAVCGTWRVTPLRARKACCSCCDAAVGESPTPFPPAVACPCVHTCMHCSTVLA